MGRSDTYFYPTSSEEYESDAPQTDRGCDMGGRKRKATPRVKTQRASAKHKPMSVEKRKRFVKLKSPARAKATTCAKPKKAACAKPKKAAAKPKKAACAKPKKAAAKPKKAACAKPKKK
ncbi:histone H1E-like [Drosophila rhopaloa]|uniref:Histone H1E-like n=1 Tax=Drosophila rhopaloa TaxID=1041015 RepID=A0A6P4DWS9_DRORH|nr:histone H1E-like [Drosophila rhopaloa]XP_016970133.1 histone H1E-like [Drosophila rhopaloa]XP_044316955.1 histone H1E-like [Drosophila rhopaloa]XP_044316956.1 histone H1E-like [Drosophila rhopaloa]XP_044316957.1 histone H1E-like [Drosophila rhopaloa]XP_044316958.1 histone H1E-like [Drosophila rhopaloa]XP_044316959.1 histone H1E-like [Drosophila rhopaloa]XP_044316960.1 histone H1E-like [Drosophila rhopaloa]